MAFKCFNCGKGRMMGHRVSHSKRRTNHAFMPNLQNRRIQVGNLMKQVKICTNCIKLAKKIAKDKEVDLSSVQGTGPGGRVVRKDVEAALSSGQQPSAASGQKSVTAPMPSFALVSQDDKVIQTTKLRQAIDEVRRRPHSHHHLGCFLGRDVVTPSETQAVQRGRLFLSCRRHQAVITCLS